jgi:hypothetical protein
MQFRSLDLVMNCMLTMSVSQVSMVRRLFVLLSLIVFCCLVEMVSRFLVITRGMVVVLPSFPHVVLLWKILAPDGDGTAQQSSSLRWPRESPDVHCLKSNRSSSSAEQVDDQDHQSDNQE